MLYLLLHLVDSCTEAEDVIVEIDTENNGGLEWWKYCMFFESYFLLLVKYIILKCAWVVTEIQQEWPGVDPERSKEVQPYPLWLCSTCTVCALSSQLANTGFCQGLGMTTPWHSPPPRSSPQDHKVWTQIHRFHHLFSFLQRKSQSCLQNHMSWGLACSPLQAAFPVLFEVS